MRTIIIQTGLVGWWEADRWWGNWALVPACVRDFYRRGVQIAFQYY